MKKIYFLIISMLFFISCTKLTIYSAYSSAKHNNYIYAIKKLENSFEINKKNIELLEAYKDLYQKGISYYIIKENEEKIFLMEKSFLSLPEKIKINLKNIYVDKKIHKERGKRVAKEILKRSNMITEDSYKNKIKKYHLYKYILNFDYDMKKNIDKKITELNKKIEKTYNIDIRGNRYFSNYLEDYLYNNLDKTYFKIRERNSDMTLYIDIDDYIYLEPKTTVKTFPRNYKKKIKNSNNQEIIENITYYENNYSKRTKLEFFISYKLVSNISGEVLFENKKHIDKKYEKKWKTYYFSPFTNSKGINIPDDEEEKEVPSKYEIVSEVLKTIHKYIELDFDNLEKIKD